VYNCLGGRCAAIITFRKRFFEEKSVNRWHSTAAGSMAPGVIADSCSPCSRSPAPRIPLLPCRAAVIFAHARADKLRRHRHHAVENNTFRRNCTGMIDRIW